MYSWLKRWASWLASCITFRARSVKRFKHYGHLLTPQGAGGKGVPVGPGGNQNNRTTRAVGTS